MYAHRKQLTHIVAVSTFIIGYILCFGGCFDTECTNIGNLSKADREEVFVLAKAEATKQGIDINKYDVHINQEGSFVAVELWPKDHFQYGGGAKLFFKKDNGGYTFVKIESWQ